MSEAERSGGEVADDLRSRFLDLKQKIGGLYVNDFTFDEAREIWKYLIGKYDPTPASTVKEVQKRIDRLEELWRMGRPADGHKQ